MYPHCPTAPSSKPPPPPFTGGGDANFSVRVLPGEPLSLRLLVDRTIIEVFAQGGRGALVAADQIFRLDHTTAYLFNTGTQDVSASVSMYGMGCGWANSLPKPLHTDDDAPVGRWTFDATDGGSSECCVSRQKRGTGGRTATCQGRRDTCCKERAGKTSRRSS